MKTQYRTSVIILTFLAILGLILAALPGPVFAGLNDWSTNGPWVGDIWSLAIVPDNPSIIYAGTSSTERLPLSVCRGAYRSIDGGDTWIRMLLDLPVNSQCVNVLMVDPLDSEILYAGTSIGFLRSTDGGLHWTRTGLEGHWVITMVLDPSDPTIWYASTVPLTTTTAGPPSLHKSTDGGASWQELPGLAGSPEVKSLVIDPNTPNVIYAGTASGSGIFRSNDGGITWTSISSGLPDSTDSSEPLDIEALVVVPGIPPTILAATSGGIFRSVDGANWAMVAGELGSTAVTWLTADLSNLSSIYAASGDRSFHSPDGGVTWNSTGERLFTPFFRIAVDPEDASRLVAGTLHAGIFRSHDGGETWLSSSRGPVTASPSRVATGTADGQTIAYAASRHGVFRSLDGGQTWRPRNNGISSRRPGAASPVVLTRISDLAVDPSDPSILYIGSDVGAGVYRSLDGGESWQPAGDLRFHLISDLIAVADSEGTSAQTTVLAATSRGIYRSIDNGESWTLTHGQSAQFLAAAPSSSSTIYAAEGPRVWRSLSNGVTWTLVSEEIEGLTALIVDPEDPFTLVAGHVLIGILHSSDGGVTWDYRSRGPIANESVISLVHGLESNGPEHRAALYAGTRNRGIFRSVDGGESWWHLPGGDRRSYISSLAVVDHPSTRGQRLYAATFTGILDLDLVPSLELHEGRFRVEVDWRDYEDLKGIANVASVAEEPTEDIPLKSIDSTTLEFFDPENWELLLKILDGRLLTDHFWVFFAAATNVEYTVTITDTLCDNSKTYFNPLGRLAPATTDIEALPDCRDSGLPTCTDDEDAICIGFNDRFRVDVEWMDFEGQTGLGQQVTVSGNELAESGDSGLLYFFSENNWELLVKVLDGCANNGHYWVLSAASTDVEYDLRVTAPTTGVSKTYSNPLGSRSDAVIDIEAFDCADVLPPG